MAVYYSVEGMAVCYSAEGMAVLSSSQRSALSLPAEANLNIINKIYGNNKHGEDFIKFCVTRFGPPEFSSI